MLRALIKIDSEILKVQINTNYLRNMNLKAIFKNRVPILVFLLVVSYHTYKTIELSRMILLLDNIVIGIFLVMVIYTSRKIYKQSFLKMMLSNLGLTLVSTVLAALVNLMIIADLGFSIKPMLGSILGTVPKVISGLIIQFIFLIMFGSITVVLTYLFAKNGKTKIVALDEDLIDDKTSNIGRAE